MKWTNSLKDQIIKAQSELIILIALYFLKKLNLYIKLPHKSKSRPKWLYFETHQIFKKK